MENLAIYNKVRKVPPEAIKTIGGGRLKGMSDINPMWRIKILTDTFGMCGIGWKYEIVDERLEKGGSDEVSAFVRINLFVKADDVWSDAIPGTGGSSFVAKDKSGLYQSDECFKMALTDALSVACKALGVAADVYWDKDNTKYTKQPAPNADTMAEDRNLKSEIGNMLLEMVNGDNIMASALLKDYTSFEGDNGKVEGKASLKDLTEKMLKVTYGKVKKDYQNFKAHAISTDPEQAKLDKIIEENNALSNKVLEAS